MPRKSRNSRRRSKRKSTRRSPRRSPRYRFSPKMSISREDKIRGLIQSSKIRDANLANIIGDYTSEQYLYYKVDKENNKINTRKTKPNSMRGWKKILIVNDDDNVTSSSTFLWVGSSALPDDMKVSFIAVAPNRTKLERLIDGRYGDGQIINVDRYRYPGNSQNSKIIARIVSDHTFDFDF